MVRGVKLVVLAVGLLATASCGAKDYVNVSQFLEAAQEAGYECVDARNEPPPVFTVNDEDLGGVPVQSSSCGHLASGEKYPSEGVYVIAEGKDIVEPFCSDVAKQDDDSGYDMDQRTIIVGTKGV